MNFIFYLILAICYKLNTLYLIYAWILEEYNLHTHLFHHRGSTSREIYR